MDATTVVAVLIVSAVLFVLYFTFLTRFNIIRRSRTIKIPDPDEYARHHIILDGRMYAKTSHRVLHKSIFSRTDIAGHFRWISYPVFVIFGPHLCYKSYPFLRAFKENKNIRLFQIREDTYKDATDEEKAQIIRYLQEREYVTIVDGVHCYVPNPYSEGEEKGGTEYLYNPVMARRYERDFDDLLRYTKEVDRERIVDSVGEENIYITRPDGKYGKAPHDTVVGFKAIVLEEPIEPGSIGFGEERLVEKLSSSRTMEKN